MVRMHNIEHEYYELLAKSEGSVFKRLYYKLEAELLRHYEDILHNAQNIFAISPKDERNLKLRFADKVLLLPAFHGNKIFRSKPGKGSFCFYHGKLSVGENHTAAMFLVNEVFSKLETPLIIAGNGAHPELIEAAKPFSNIQIHENYSPEEIMKKIQEAHINVLPTFQPTGIKLKLINTLYNGRHILVNSPMIEETGLQTVCHIANTAEEFRKSILELMSAEFRAIDLEQRIQLMGQEWDDSVNVYKLIQEMS